MFSRFPIINLMNSACIEGSRQLVRDFNELSFLKANRKIDQFIARTISRTQNIMQENLEKSNPGHGLVFRGKIIKQSSTNIYWLINVLEGEENFIHRFPFFGISVVLIKDNKPLNLEESDFNHEMKIDLINHDIISSMFFDPTKNEVFWAQKEGGSFLNAKKLNMQQFVPNTTKLIAGSGIKCNRNFGSNLVNLAYLAASRVDEATGNIDEIASFYTGKLLIEEAKGSFLLKNSSFIAR